jgi:hypothetical protein
MMMVLAMAMLMSMLHLDRIGDRRHIHGGR